MASINRRTFIKAGLAGGVIMASGLPFVQAGEVSPLSVDRVALGSENFQVSRLAMGLGTNGWNHQSNQTRMGLEKFLPIAKAGYERGVRFLDTADT